MSEHPAAPSTVATLLVNYNGWRFTASVARQLLLAGHDPSRIIVVDNASADGSAAQLARLLPAAVIIANANNVGFAAACNQGVAHAWRLGAPAVLLLNSDVSFGPGFLRALLADAPAPEEAEARSPEIHWMRPPGEPWFAGAWWRGGLPGELDHRPAGDPRLDVDVLWSTALLLTPAAWRRAGPFDPGFFLYYEDVDWCLRAGRAGVRMHVHPHPDARIWHAVSHRTGGHAGALRRFHMTRSRLRFRRLHGPRWATGAGIRVAVGLGATALRLAGTGQPAALAAHLRGLAHGVGTHAAPASEVAPSAVRDVHADRHVHVGHDDNEGRDDRDDSDGHDVRPAPTA